MTSKLVTFQGMVIGELPNRIRPYGACGSRSRDHFVYFLKCPESLEVKYIGATCDPIGRAMQHARLLTPTTREWVSSLRKSGHIFIMQTIGRPLCYEDACKKELRLIVKHMDANPRTVLNKVRVAI